jgi:hypothetical protein
MLHTEMQKRQVQLHVLHYQLHILKYITSLKSFKPSDKSRQFLSQLPMAEQRKGGNTVPTRCCFTITFSFRQLQTASVYPRSHLLTHYTALVFCLQHILESVPKSKRHSSLYWGKSRFIQFGTGPHLLIWYDVYINDRKCVQETDCKVCNVSAENNDS